MTGFNQNKLIFAFFLLSYFSSDFFNVWKNLAVLNVAVLFEQEEQQENEENTQTTVFDLETYD